MTGLRNLDYVTIETPKLHPIGVGEFHNGKAIFLVIIIVVVIIVAVEFVSISLLLLILFQRVQLQLWSFSCLQFRPW